MTKGRWKVPTMSRVLPSMQHICSQKTLGSNMGCHTCFLPRALSNLVTPVRPCLRSHVTCLRTTSTESSRDSTYALSTSGMYVLRRCGSGALMYGTLAASLWTKSKFGGDAVNDDWHPKRTQLKKAKQAPGSKTLCFALTSYVNGPQRFPACARKRRISVLEKVESEHRKCTRYSKYKCKTNYCNINCTAWLTQTKRLLS